MPINTTGSITHGLDVDPFSKLDQVAAKAWKAAELKLSRNVEQPQEAPAPAATEISDPAAAREALAATTGMVSQNVTQTQHALDPARVAELLGL